MCNAMVVNGLNIIGIDVKETENRIGQMIKDSGLSDKDLGEKLGLSVQSVNKWRHGRGIPDIENLYLLSKILEVRIDDFIVPAINNVSLTCLTERITEVDIVRRLSAVYLKIRRECSFCS